jgi:hypothetical protein
MSTMIKPSRKAVAFASLAFATALAGCGSSSNTTASNASQGAGTAQGTTPQGTTPGGRGGRGGFGGNMDTAALAKALGVSETKLKAAIAKARPAGFGNGQRPTTPPTTPQGTTPGAGGPGRGAGMTDMFATIAKELGLTTAKVQQAFQAQMPQMGQGGPPNGTPPNGQQAPAASGTSS